MMSINQISVPNSETIASTTERSKANNANISPGRLITWTILFQIAWNAQKLPAIIREGAFPDPDDFLRLHQVRNWLAGQGWYDTFVARMDPPLGGDIHWSRLVDVPIALLIKFFSLFTEASLAERLTAIVWPTTLLVCVTLVMVAICERVTPKVNKLLPLLFTVTCVSAIVEFSPGRLDHHNLQILLFSLVLLGLVNRDRAWGHYLIGAAIAFSITIGVDAILLHVLLLGFIGMDWALGRDDDGLGLMRTAMSMSVCGLILFTFFISPDKWWYPRPDSYSLFFLVLLLLVSAGFCALFLASPSLPQGESSHAVLARLGAGAIAAAFIAVLLMVLFPENLTGNFANLSTELQSRWLNDITEAQSLPVMLARSPDQWLSTVAFFAVVLLAGLAVIRYSPLASRHMVAIYCVMALSMAATLFQYRLLRIGILASIPVCIAFLQMSWETLQHRFSASKRKLWASISAIALLLLSPTWLVAGLAVPGGKPEKPPLAMRSDASGTAAARGAGLGQWRNEPIYPICNRASQFATLAKIPKGKVLNDLDSGPAILVFTHHDIVSGNYHRNGRTILQTLNFFERDAATARQIADEIKADYVGFCDPGTALPTGAKERNMLNVRILDGRLPVWLKRMSPASERFIVLKIVRD